MKATDEEGKTHISFSQGPESIDLCVTDEMTQVLVHVRKRPLHKQRCGGKTTNGV